MTTDHYRYLGDSVSALCFGDGTVRITRDFSTAMQHVIDLDPLVLDEFLAWIEEQDPPVWRAERVEVSNEGGVLRVLLDIDPDDGPVEVQTVPRCEACRWWRRMSGYGGECGFSDRPGESAPMWASDDEGYRCLPIYTRPDFGCVQWEGKSDE